MPFAIGPGGNRVGVWLERLGLRHREVDLVAEEPTDRGGTEDLTNEGLGLEVSAEQR
jgi:hypothetical protein